MSTRAPLLWIDGQPFQYVPRVEHGRCRDCGMSLAGLEAFRFSPADADGTSGAAEPIAYCAECAEQHAALSAG